MAEPAMVKAAKALAAAFFSSRAGLGPLSVVQNREKCERNNGNVVNNVAVHGLENCWQGSVQTDKLPVDYTQHHQRSHLRGT